MHIVIATLVSKPDKASELAALLKDLAATSRNDPGCMSYHFHSDLDDPNTFRSIEMWSTKDATDAHMQTEHVAAAVAAAPDLLAAELQIDEYPTV